MGAARFRRIRTIAPTGADTLGAAGCPPGPPGPRPPGQGTRRPGWVVAVDALGLVLFAAAAAFALGRLEAPASWLEAAHLMLWVAAGIAAADLLSGLVHWFADTFLAPDTPLLGPALIAGFREHHRDPDAITRHGVVELAGQTAAVAAPALVAAGLVAGGGHALAAPGGVFLAALGLAAAATNGIHLFAHRRDAPVAVAWLQRHGLVLSPEHHARHHAGDHRRSYCITTGWWNPWLDRAAFFPRLERAIRTLGAYCAGGRSRGAPPARASR